MQTTQTEGEVIRDAALNGNTGSAASGKPGKCPNKAKPKTEALAESTVAGGKTAIPVDVAREIKVSSEIDQRVELSQQKRQRQQKKVQKARPVFQAHTKQRASVKSKGQLKAAEKAVVEAVKESAAKVAGESDAAKAKALEEAKVKADEERARGDALYRTMVSRAMAPFAEVAWYSKSQDEVGFLSDCAPRREMLLRVPLLMHREVMARRLTGPEDIRVYSLGDDGSLLPQVKALAPVQPGRYGDVTYLVYKVDVGLWGEDLRVSEHRVTVGVEHLLHMLEKRPKTGSFPTTVDAVRQWRRTHPYYAHDAYVPDRDSELADQLIAALLCMQDRTLSGDYLTVKAVLGGLKQKFSSVMTNHGLGPVVEGSYALGYRTNIDNTLDKIANGVFTLNEKAAITCRKGMDQVDLARQKVHDFYDRGVDYCRGAPEVVSGITPAFPDPRDLSNLEDSYIKRWCGKPIRAAGAMKRKVEECVAALVALRGESVAVEVPDVDEVIASTSKGFWTLDQAAEYALGVREGRDMPLTQLIPKVTALCATEVKTFVKAEGYDADEIKCDRFIVSPSHYLRGVAAGVFSLCSDRVCKAFSGMNVKGLDVLETTKHILGKFDTSQCLIRTDFTSFEAQNDPWLRRKVATVCSKFSEEADRVYQVMMAFENECLASLGGEHKLKLVLPNIRWSGIAWTSVGNQVGNLLMTLSAAATAGGCSLKEFVAKQVVLVEGDDGIVWAGTKEFAQRFRAALSEIGASVTSEVKESIFDLGFCSRPYLEENFQGTGLPPGIVTWKNPCYILAKANWWLNADKTTNKFDGPMQVARALGLLTQFPHLPICSAWCAGLVKRNIGLAKVIVEDYNGARKLPTDAVFRDMFWRAEPTRLGDIEELLIRAVVVGPVARARMLEETGLSVETQQAYEKLAEEGAVLGVEVEMPQLEQWWRGKTGAGAVRQFAAAGRRKVQQAAVAHEAGLRVVRKLKNTVEEGVSDTQRWVRSFMSGAPLVGGFSAVAWFGAWGPLVLWGFWILVGFLGAMIVVELLLHYLCGFRWSTIQWFNFACLTLIALCVVSYGWALAGPWIVWAYRLRGPLSFLMRL